MAAEPSKVPFDPGREEKRQAEQELEAKLIEGLSSGERTEADKQFFEEKIRRFRERYREHPVSEG